ncbi:MAG: MarR family transcriptional regulator [Thermoflexales bacterium]|nr:MarR family transcriptional regulator [Thermoflexales bacterium]MCS7325618.1 MarR family transcriptional regulator [Thermoflexales bacterium]MCX7938900.1 MarR family transcriptional regulator [Thermoflexales bacterium]MDW8054363.1 MarR family transcriptional regulator [Anaerolineae bacterium]MDW8291475.1 MarR family transcriptional regulator [Anaerolineae bacterium]
MVSEHELARAFMQLVPQMAHAVAEALRSDGDPNTLMQAHTLRMLSEKPRSFKELVALRRVSAPTLSRTINALVKRGWVERVPHAHDRRQVLLRLTPAGLAEFERLRAQVQAHLAARFCRLSPADRATLWRALNVLERALQAETLSPDPLPVVVER